jgi:hypothetical protein
LISLAASEIAKLENAAESKTGRLEAAADVC